MENKKEKEENAVEVSQGKQENKAKLNSLPRMEMYAVLGLELGQKIFEMLQQVQNSVEILARQKALELNPDQSAAKKTP